VSAKFCTTCLRCCWTSGEDICDCRAACNACIQCVGKAWVGDMQFEVIGADNIVLYRLYLSRNVCMSACVCVKGRASYITKARVGLG
jgi:hypothetical protein